MELNKAIKERIEYYMKIKGLNVYRLSKLAGLTLPTLSTFLNNNSKKLIQLDSLLHVCEGLGITLEDFFDSEMFNKLI